MDCLGWGWGWGWETKPPLDFIFLVLDLPCLTGCLSVLVSESAAKQEVERTCRARVCFGDGDGGFGCQKPIQWRNCSFRPSLESLEERQLPKEIDSLYTQRRWRRLEFWSSGCCRVPTRSRRWRLLPPSGRLWCLRLGLPEQLQSAPRPCLWGGVSFTLL